MDSQQNAVKATLSRVVNSVPGLCQLLVADSDAIPVLSVSSGSLDRVSPHVLSVFPSALEQMKKLSMGNHQSLACVYGKLQLVILNYGSLIVTMIALESANLGLLLAQRPVLEPIIMIIKQAAAEILPKD